MIAKNLVSVVIPTINLNQNLAKLLNQLIEADFEIILVNQTGASIFDSTFRINKIKKFHEVIINSIIPAYSARNLGASRALCEYILFLDDDSIFFNKTYNLINGYISNYLSNDFFIFNRGYVQRGCYMSYNQPIKKFSIKHRISVSYLTEWSFCIRKSIFEKIGGFPPIGIGSEHRAQSGEAFVIFCNFRLESDKIMYFENVKISHPPYDSKKNVQLCLDYAYGSGYSVGFGLEKYHFLYKLYWYMKSFMASFKFFVTLKNTPRPIEKISQFYFRFNLFCSKNQGLFDSIFLKYPRRQT